MGRFPNIAAAKAKTGAAKGKLYGMYAKEIYMTTVWMREGKRT